MPLKIAFLTTDNREQWSEYHRTQPVFGPAPEALLQGFSMLPDVEVDIVSCIRQPMTSPEKVAPNLRYHPVLVPKIGWMTTGYQGTIRAVRRKLRELQPDIVHGQGTERDCAMSAAFSGFPNVVTIHGNMAELARLFRERPFSYYWLASRLETLALRRTAGVFCNSRYTEGLVKPRARKTWRVDNPIREEFFSKPVPVSEKAPFPTIINVGVVGPRKQQVQILNLAMKLNREGCRVRFLFVGVASEGSDYGRDFLSGIQRAEEAGYGSYLGVKNIGELVGLYDSCDAMLHFPFEEAFGLVVAEALARNLKFFGSDVGGIPGIASAQEGTELFPINDWEGLGAAIKRWVDAGSKRPLSASSAMFSRYHPKVIAARHVEIYREVLSGQ